MEVSLGVIQGCLSGIASWVGLVWRVIQGGLPGIVSWVGVNLESYSGWFAGVVSWVGVSQGLFRVVCRG